MASRILLHRTHALSRLSRRAPIQHVLRTYATTIPPNRPTQNASGLLDQAFAQQTRSARDEYRDSVGPIPMGMIRPSIRYDEKVKKWSELSTAGKVGRATARTGNLTVILLGAGLTAMLVYALTSELFSQNSPTVVYNRACDKITASPRIAAHLPGPLKFHNTPPSSLRPRHRNPHVSSQIMVDSTGREHMFLTFFVSSSPSSSSSSETLESRLEQAWEKVSEMSLDQALVAARDTVEGWGESALAGVRYLVGKSTPATPAGNVAGGGEVQKEEKKSAWSFVGLFSSLHSSRSEDGSVQGAKGVFTEGEVHAELIRNDDGYFAFRYLLVDVPSSKTWNKTRIFVERAPGVSEREPVMSAH